MSTEIDDPDEDIADFREEVVPLVKVTFRLHINGKEPCEKKVKIARQILDDTQFMYNYVARLFGVEVDGTQIQVRVDNSRIPVEVDVDVNGWFEDVSQKQISFENIRPPVEEMQKLIAERLLDMAINLVKGNQYERLQVLILVPKYTTLEEQTVFRLRKMMQHFDIQDYNQWCKVLKFGVSVGNADTTDQFHLSVIQNANTLHLLILDECHFGPTCNRTSANSVLNNEDCMRRPNFVPLLVSATPENCLSTNTRINEVNILKWNSVKSDNVSVPAYISLEYYFSTIGFSIAHIEDLNFKIVTNIRNQELIISIEKYKYQEFASYAAVAERISFVINEELKRLNEEIQR